MLLIVLALICILVYLYINRHQGQEKFWDGYTPIPALNLETVRYGKTAVLANLDEPEIMCDPSALNVNTYY